SAVDEPVVFTARSRPSTAEVLQGPRFNPSSSCNGDVGSDREFKWVQFSFNEFGSKTVSATLFVRPRTNANEELVLYYRLFAKKADQNLRVPEDPQFGSQESTSVLDSCYAKTVEIPLEFMDGQSVCNENACINTLFYNNETAAINGLSTPLGQKFALNANLRTFKPLNAPFLRVETEANLDILEHDFGTTTPLSQTTRNLNIPLTLTDEAYGNVIFRGILPSQNAKIKLTLGDAAGTLLEVPRFAIVTGRGRFTATLSAQQLKANQDNRLAVTLQTERGTPVEYAKVLLKESSESPFDGFPGGIQSILGDGTEGRGLDGVYQFHSLRPTSVGELNVVITRDGFVPETKPLKVVADQPLDFDRDPSLIELSCTDSNLLLVTNKL
ncbi:MAG TPA: hypothetical protein VI874_05225, partial [Candidatus Norongarragalinales archaeon]|nr:hypothetical protein [Candidatus Norongarragalinales archaeon]